MTMFLTEVQESVGKQKKLTQRRKAAEDAESIFIIFSYFIGYIRQLTMISNKKDKLSNKNSAFFAPQRELFYSLQSFTKDTEDNENQTGDKYE